MSAGTVLVVDDEPTNIEILAVLLEREYEVAFATSGEQALGLVAAVKPDLILLDVMLPGLDGYGVCARLKQDPASADIPVVFITGLDRLEDETRAREAGAADYVTKPFSPPLIRACVRTQIALRRVRAELREPAVPDEVS
jgi:putative two-component system response regulator